MNLLTDPVFPVINQTGEHHLIRLSELGDSQWQSLHLPRADLRMGAMQFMIAVLQTTCAPRDEDKWLTWYESPPDAETLTQRIAPFVEAFWVFGEPGNKASPRFMQDLDPLADKPVVSVGSLFLDAPGGNALRLNTDHFVVRDQVQHLSPFMTTMALFTLQSSAPSGGAGYRTGIRGGGPLSCVLQAGKISASLWEQLWLNVLPLSARPEFAVTDHSPEQFSRIFPWCAPTTNSKRADSALFPNDPNIHPLTVYWAMPWRVRLQDITPDQRCDLTGITGDVVTHFHLTNYGNNYEGHWRHPLCHYREDSKTQDLISTKGKPLDYRYWDALTLVASSLENASSKAKYINHLPQVVSHYLNERYESLYEVLEVDDINAIPQLWCAGYDMDKAKAKGYYTSILPILMLPTAQQDAANNLLRRVLAAADACVSITNAGIKEALTTQTKQVPADYRAVKRTFYQASQTAFFALLTTLQHTASHDPSADLAKHNTVIQRLKQWRIQAAQCSEQLFADHALSGIDQGEPKHMARVAHAHRKFINQLWGNPAMKALKETIQATDKEASQ